jgi:DNA-binding CsgD family transcriptional regulator
VHRISTVEDPDDFARTATVGLFDLIPCDVSTYSEINPVRGRAVPMTYPAEAERPDAREAFSRNIAEHPQVAFYAAGNTSASMMSDFLSSRQFRRTQLYDELFRPVAGEYVLTALLPLPPPIVAGWGLLRSGRDFSERDRVLLDLLQPHLVTAYERSLLRVSVGAIDEAATRGDQRLVVLGMDGDVLYMTPPALGALRRFFGTSVREDALPEVVAEWLAADRRHPLTVAVDGRRLRIDSLGGRPAALLLTERAATPSPDMLIRLGLSRREAEVLAHVAEGRTNAEIARLLSVTPGTVKRHLEHVYVKLGVHRRTEAAAAAWAECDASTTG